MAEALETEIIEIVRKRADPGVEVTPATGLTELGIHSLELTEIIFDLEEHYGIEIEMNTVDAWNNLKDVADVVAAVSALVKAKA
jgi:nodulation protein F